MELERRDFEVERLAVRGAGGATTVSGMAAPFNRDSELLGGGFVERIDPGAFRTSLKHNDVVLLWQHQAEEPITRMSTGLELEQRRSGLFFTAPAGDFTERQLDLLDRGVVRNMSFGFLTRKDEWDQTKDPVRRTILDADLREISPVTFAAYHSTKVAVRSAERRGIDLTRKRPPKRRESRTPRPRPHPGPEELRVLLTGRDARSIRAVSVHEAGHATMYVIEGRRLKEVFLHWRRDWDGWCLKGGRCDPLGHGDTSRAVYLAGMAAVALAGLSDADPDEWSTGDRQRAGVTRYVDRRDVEEQLRYHFPAIRALADRLMKQGSVGGREAEKIILDRLYPAARSQAIQAQGRCVA